MFIQYQQLYLLILLISKDKRLPTDQFGFFIGKNGSYNGILTMLTGQSDINRIGEVLAFDGKERLSVWYGEECNRIR